MTKAGLENGKTCGAAGAAEKKWWANLAPQVPQRQKCGAAGAAVAPQAPQTRMLAYMHARASAHHPSTHPPNHPHTQTHTHTHLSVLMLQPVSAK